MKSGFDKVTEKIASTITLPSMSYKELQEIMRNEIKSMVNIRFSKIETRIGLLQGQVVENIA